VLFARGFRLQLTRQGKYDTHVYIKGDI